MGRRYRALTLDKERKAIRIYSTDKELAEFNRFWRGMEMRPDGDAFKGISPKFVGEVNIPDASVAKIMGVDFDVLQRHGFEVHFIR
ncbi:MAG: hypothetical protein PHG00_05350 [Methylococcales bacterium]|nr:hypothetical protein [Methylococcales bacterium]